MTEQANAVDPDAEAASEEPTDEDPAADDHLSEVKDGAGCTEIWEHLSERRSDPETDD
jgi:hypothetical protein